MESEVRYYVLLAVHCNTLVIFMYDQITGIYTTSLVALIALRFSFVRSLIYFLSFSFKRNYYILRFPGHRFFTFYLEFSHSSYFCPFSLIRYPSYLPSFHPSFVPSFHLFLSIYFPSTTVSFILPFLLSSPPFVPLFLSVYFPFFRYTLSLFFLHYLLFFLSLWVRQFLSEAIQRG